MNPVIKPVDGHAIYELTDEDRKRINRISLVGGGEDLVAIISHRMCVMQMVSLLTTDANRNLRAEWEKYQADLEAYREWTTLPHNVRRETPKPPFPLHPSSMDDHPPCVSETIADAMIQVNDSVESTQLRNRLKKVVEDILNTCPLKVVDQDGRVEEVRDQTEAYQAAEKERKSILEPVYDYNPQSPGGISFAKCLELIREAAAVYKVTEETETAI